MKLPAPIPYSSGHTGLCALLSSLPPMGCALRWEQPSPNPPLPNSCSSFRLMLPGKSPLTRTPPSGRAGGPQALPVEKQTPPPPPSSTLHTPSVVPYTPWHRPDQCSGCFLRVCRRVRGGRVDNEQEPAVCVEEEESLIIWVLVDELGI